VAAFNGEEIEMIDPFNPEDIPDEALFEMIYEDPCDIEDAIGQESVRISKTKSKKKKAKSRKKKVEKLTDEDIPL
jgi:hypothetical protein